MMNNKADIEETKDEQLTKQPIDTALKIRKRFKRLNSNKKPRIT